MKRWACFFFLLFHIAFGGEAAQPDNSQSPFSLFLSGEWRFAKDNKGEESASIGLTVRILSLKDDADWECIALDVSLIDPQGKEAAHSQIAWFEREGNAAWGRLQLPIYHPILWNAEHPSLYRLAVELRRRGETLNRVERLVAPRRVETVGGELRLNGVPIKLRGAVYRDIETQTPSEDLWRRNLEFLRGANINAIFFPHPPHPRLMELCGQYGFYVVCNIPFGADSLPASAAGTIHPASGIKETIQAYSLDPALIAWNLPCGELEPDAISGVVKSLKEWDASRSLIISGPSAESYLEQADLWAPACESLDDLKRLSRLSQPAIVIGYPAALDNAMEGLEELWPEIRRNPQLTGAFIDPFEDKNAAAAFADKILPANYFLIRKAYSPIQIEEDIIPIKPGKRTVELTLHNFYEFSNLQEASCRWTLWRNREQADSGAIQLQLPPRQKMAMALVLNIPGDVVDHEYNLVMQFSAPDGRLIDESSAWLKPADWEKSFLMRLRDMIWNKKWKVDAAVDEIRIEAETFLFRLPAASPSWFLLLRQGNYRLVTGGPYIRLGRQPSLVDRLHQQEGRLTLPEPFLLKDLKTQGRVVNPKGDEVEIQSVYASIPADDPSRAVVMQLDVLASPFGFCDVRYRLDPGPAVRNFLEVGLSFLIPARLDRILWLGDGPYPSYPGGSLSSHRGIFGLSPLKDFAPGNRLRVNLAAFVDEKGNGLGIMMLDGSLAFEPGAEGTLVSVNSAAAGLGDRFHPSRHLLSSSRLDETQRSASFRLIPLERNRYPKLFEELMKN
ncbi:MAG: glycoside hydrolase family 2 TIM barrel-domain containing protein [Candidatus Omnitrophota bacterium]